MNFEESIVVSENADGVLGHAPQAREFLNKARGYLAAGDLHQASEQGWGAAARMAKAVAPARGWPHERHSRFPPGDEPIRAADRQRPGAAPARPG